VCWGVLTNFLCKLRLIFSLPWGAGAPTAPLAICLCMMKFICHRGSASICYRPTHTVRYDTRLFYIAQGELLTWHRV